MRRRYWVALIVAALVALSGGGVLVLGAFAMVAGMDGGDSSSTELASGPECGVVAKGVPIALDKGEQRENATTIVEVGLRLKVPERGLIVALATAMQESGLRNLSYGDRDSLGLFQQRPISGWGTPAQITDPVLSAEAFFGRAKHTSNPGLLDISGWKLMTITGAAQAVQRSRFPDAYARHEATATLAVQQILGKGVAQVCTVEQVAGSCPASIDLSGYANGRIPDSALCNLDFAKGHRLRSDAALAAEKLSVAYKQEFGHPLCVTDSYRDYDTQVRLKREKGYLAATPGTSNHGWGQAMDLCGGINTGPSAASYRWMKANAPGYGWVHPAWAEPGGSGPLEFWHWEFGVH